MNKLTTNYLGIELKNPLIVGASNLVTDKNNLQKLEEKGAAAIVYKSLFEEQIQLESLQLQDQLDKYNERHAEMIDLFPGIDHAGPEEFLHELQRAKEAVDIPIIANVNAVNPGSWVEYAKQIEQTGVDALELNLYHLPRNFDKEGKEIVKEHLEILTEVKKNTNLPVSVKLTPFYTNILKLVKELDKEGAQGFVLFNRLFQPDIDIEREEHHFPYNLSNENDNRLALRFSGLLFNNINANICASGGIFTGDDLIKMIMAGADCVQVVSTIYKNGIDQVEKILKELNNWMENKSYNSLDDFKGKLSNHSLKDPFAYKRAQYIDILMKSDKIFTKYPLH